MYLSRHLFLIFIFIIILGFTFGNADGNNPVDLSKYITSEVLKTANGGISRWAVQGGCINQSTWENDKKITPAPGSTCPPRQ